MQQYIKQNNLRDQDQAWLVIDKDNNSDDRPMKLCTWSKQKSNYGFALSNPCFEYWLLLHFEDGNQIKSKKDCINRLKRHLPGYDKGIKADQFTLDKIKEAICRAQKRDHPRCANWPDTCGGTTVYQLVEKMIKTET